MDAVERIVAIYRELAASVDTLPNPSGAARVYNPLVYARRPWERYLRRFATPPKRVVFLGMNPGPWGMAQTGVPFGEIAAVRRWMGIEEAVDQPPAPHPKRPIEGFACPRSEVSGRRLWGLFSEHSGDASTFFADHFVLNYCPLVYMEESGRNLTPDKLPATYRHELYAACDDALRRVVEVLSPEWAIGVGAFAETRLKASLAGSSAPIPVIGRILHPSPASPRANRGWADEATRQLREMGIWS